MTNYPPELIEDFRKLAEPRGWLRGVEFDGEHWDSVSVDLAFFTFAHNWHRVRELEGRAADLERQLRAIRAGHTKTIEFDLSPAMAETELRKKLIEMGWTPPQTTGERQ